MRAIQGPALLMTIVFGFYIGLHGQLTPGGGFQAGVILATAPLLVYICENTRSLPPHHFALRRSKWSMPSARARTR